ncbi:D-isomer specific 2-hydroxyacid dehydrogenase, catalytic domain-containing protein, partial [Cynara cardunculus var. scolymus]
MDPEDHHSTPSQSPDLRQVLVLRPPPVFSVHEQYFSKFQILKAYDSPLPTLDFLHAHAQSVKVVLCSAIHPITADVIRKLPELQLVVSAATGVNHIDMAECGRRGIRVTNVGDVFSDDVADGAVGLLVDVLRRISGGDRFVRGGSWPDAGAVATRLEAMGCIVSYTSRQRKHSTSFIFYPDVFQLASESDVLIICCALTDDTRHMIDSRVMSALGKTGVIVNVARGAIIDEATLVKRLVEGEIGGAGLDVFENEPNVPKELFGMDNVVLLPHRTAFTKEAFHDAAQILIANLEAFFTNKKHHNSPLPESSDLRQVLVLRPPPVFAIHEHYFSNKFQILKAYESTLPTHDFLKAYAQSVKVVLCSGMFPITAEVLRDLPALQLLVSSATGVNHIDMAECRRRGIRVSNIVDVFSDDVADAAVGLLIDVMRRISSGDRFVRGGRWPAAAEYPLGSKQKKHSTPFTFYPNVLQLASDSDALILCCVLTDATRHMIDNKVMRALGKTGVIVNVARGAVIDEVEFVKCLVEGEIAGAGLDVFENEPDVPKDLFGLDNVVLLPHITACTEESFHDAVDVLI